MSKNFKPIILVAGDPKSIFLEIFFKSLHSQRIKNPLILIVNEKILLNQMKILKYKFRINELNPKNIEYKKIDNRKINFINVPLNNKFLRK